MDTLSTVKFMENLDRIRSDFYPFPHFFLDFFSLTYSMEQSP
jgi:hypothetical protein